MLPGDQKEAIHSLDKKKNYQRGRNVGGKLRGSHRMGGDLNVKFIFY